MLNRNRNVASKLQERFAQDARTEPQQSRTAASPVIGAPSSVGGVALTWLEDGEPRHAFIWGLSTFDDEAAVFL